MITSIDAIVVYDADGVGGGAYAELNGVGEVTGTDERTVSEVKLRGEETILNVVGMKSGPTSFQLLYQPSDTGYMAIKAAYDGRTDIGLGFLDADLLTAVAGDGWEGDYKIASMTKGQPVDDTWWVEVNAVPSAEAAAISPRDYTPGI